VVKEPFLKSVSILRLERSYGQKYQGVHCFWTTVDIHHKDTINADENLTITYRSWSTERYQSKQIFNVFTWTFTYHSSTYQPTCHWHSYCEVSRSVRIKMG